MQQVRVLMHAVMYAEVCGDVCVCLCSIQQVHACMYACNDEHTQDLTLALAAAGGSSGRLSYLQVD